ncbi:MAG TPA: BTAD domain-containing putative transcriptional regulator [Acidobacteriota bacterium]|nr:BTAD domain-containing putative transcriptional regulator [Acidobacteriota bacterium]
MPGLAVYLLGPPRLQLEGEPCELSRRKSLALIAYLAVQGEGVRRDALSSFLWPEYDSRRSRANLRQNLASLLRRGLGPYLRSTRSLVELKRGSQVWIDVGEFRQCLKRKTANSYDFDSLGQMVSLFRGDFMEGFSLPDSPEFDDWQSYQSESLRSLYQSAVEKLVEGRIAQGRLQEAMSAAQSWLRLDPLCESAHRDIMKLHAWMGRRADALRQYRHCVQRLDRELDVKPEVETSALYQSIVDGEINPRNAPRQVEEQHLPE